MKTFVGFLLLVLIATGAVGQSGSAVPVGPAAEKAKKMVLSGVAFYQKNGAEKTWDAVDDVKGAFRDGEYYLFVFDVAKADSAVCLARGDGNKALLGKDMWATKDPDGQLYIQSFAKVATSKEAWGWVDYKRTNPETKKIEPKSSYIALIPGTKIFVGCGFYKD
jgi:signal transduction histidine kinase